MGKEEKWSDKAHNPVLVRSSTFVPSHIVDETALQVADSPVNVHI